MGTVKLYTKKHPYWFLAVLVLASTVLIWLPFLLRQSRWFGLEFTNPSMLTVYSHFDGPLYVIAAKTAYFPEAISRLPIELPIRPGYFAAHLPLYPALIRMYTPVMGYLKSMIFVNLAATTCLVLFFFFLARKWELSKRPLVLASVLLFFPRFLTVRSVGAPESLFMLFILASVFFFEEKNYWVAGLMGGLAAMTKSPGILLFPAFILVLVERFLQERRINLSWFGFLLIPAGLLAVFGLYAVSYGDFFAYFNSGDNIHLVSPFAVFNSGKLWVGTVWLEDALLWFFFYTLAVLSLFKSVRRSLFYVPLVFLIAVSLVEHRDISRYSLPILPFAVIAFENFLTSKKFITALVILLPAIYLFAWNFMGQNVMPIANWAPYM